MFPPTQEMKSSAKRTRGGAELATGSGTGGKSETARNGIFVAILFGVLLCLIVFVSMMIGNVAFRSGSSSAAGGSSAGQTFMSIDESDETINPVNGQAKFSGRESPALCKDRIRFPRVMIAGPCEGYFDEPRNKSTTTSEDGESYHADLPLPVRRRFAFCGMDEWARRLQLIEKAAIRDEAADTPSTGIQVHRQRGLAISRITRKFLGNKEFTDWLSFTDKYLEDHPKMQREHGGPGKVFMMHDEVQSGAAGGAAGRGKALREAEYIRRTHARTIGAGDLVCWTGDFRDHYVLGFNVVPSEEFYHYVLTKYNALEGIVGPDGL